LANSHKEQSYVKLTVQLRLNRGRPNVGSLSLPSVLFRKHSKSRSRSRIK